MQNRCRIHSHTICKAPEPFLLTCANSTRFPNNKYILKLKFHYCGKNSFIRTASYHPHMQLWTDPQMLTEGQSLSICSPGIKQSPGPACCISQSVKYTPRGGEGDTIQLAWPFIVGYLGFDFILYTYSVHLKFSFLNGRKP